MEEKIKVYIKVDNDNKEVIESKYDTPYKVYMHINKIDNKKYIGITKQPINNRFRYDGTGYIHSPKFYNAIKNYGWNNFEHIILEENLTRFEASQKEQYYIKLYATREREKGYNMTNGGEGSIKINVSEETRQKLSVSNKGKKRTLLTRQRLSKALMGKKVTEETRQRLSESHIGHKLGDYAKQVALQTLKESAVKRRKQIIGYSKDGTTIEFNSINEAAIYFNNNRFNKCFKQCVEHGWTISGYVWKYKED